MGWTIAFLLVAAIVILPASLVDRILYRMWPDLISSAPFAGRLKLIVKFMLNHKDLQNLSVSDDAVRQKISSLIKSKKLLESNLFFVELLQNLSGFLRISITDKSYEKRAIMDIVVQATDHIIQYSAQLKETPGLKNQSQRIAHAASLIGVQIRDTLDYISREGNSRHLAEAKTTMKRNAERFDAFMRNELLIVKNQLAYTNRELSESMTMFINK